MALLEILRYPDSRLRNRAKPVDTIDAETRQLVDDMFETMYKASGIGLAAIQVNSTKRLLVLDISEQRDDPLCLINPEILSKEGESKEEEGCLSVPGIYEPVKRATHILVKALDRDGNSIELELEGLPAVCVQHEIDHLDGKLFIDHLSRLKSTRIRKKLEKEARQADD
ncbi:MAG: peptide deformylase [Candidatus Polarisedimenticolaceae bacterium]|nr:peptide deformylase [Candidatus Polarisedimenticolaceae bacterium]